MDIMRTRARRTGAALIAGLAGLALVALAGCGSSGAGYGGAGASTSTTSGGSTFKIGSKSVTVNGKATTVLADASGKTLYYFTPDTATQAACVSSCARTWPPLLAPASGTVSQPSLPGNVTRVSTSNGAQVAYNGHFLYTFSGDASASDAKGEGILGKWFVATPDLAANGGGASGGSPTPTAGYSY